MNKKGRLRARYTNAYRKLLANGVNLKTCSDISAFVKLERYYEEGKSPRMIMGRNPMFNILYAQIVEPIERAFFKLPQVANACDYAKCGEKFSKLVGDWFMENDMSKFEGSQRWFTLRLEHLVYSKCTDADRKLLDILFSYKTIKKGHTTTGVGFDFVECRGSGDMDTSLGNGILNYIATMYFLIVNYCPNCHISMCAEPGCKTTKFVVKGDDSYASIPRIAKYVNTYEYFGFDAKIVIRKSPEDVEFCSGHFIEIRPGVYFYVQKLQKLIESLTTCVNEDAIRNGWVGHYYKSLGLMYSVLYKNIPIYEDIGGFLNATNEFGLNVNLVESYNLLDAFCNLEYKSHDVDVSMAKLSVSLVNRMDYAELDRISIWLRTHRLELPKHLNKRCNIKTAKLNDVAVVDFNLLNHQITATRLDKVVRKYYNLCRSNN